VAVRCPPTKARRCTGTLRIEKGDLVLARRSFSIAADRTRFVSVRVSRRALRMVRARKRMKVSVELLTRGADGQLRRAAAKLTLRAAR
jgi:hypothetical protein